MNTIFITLKIRHKINLYDIKYRFAKIKSKLRDLKHFIKHLTLTEILVCIISFIACWVILNIPLIFGFIMFGITRDSYWSGIAIGWFMFADVPSFPIPVIPICLATSIRQLAKYHKKHKKNINDYSIFNRVVNV